MTREEAIKYLENELKLSKSTLECVPPLQTERAALIDYIEAIGMAVKALQEPERPEGCWQHLGGDEWCCTACCHVIHTEGSWEIPDAKYCEECGADMKGEQK